jgi:hypothetical protein
MDLIYICYLYDMSIKQVIKDPLVQIVAAGIAGLIIFSLSSLVNPGHGPLLGYYPVISGVSVFIVAMAYANAGIDAEIIESGQNVNHPKRFAIRASLAIIFSLIAFGFTWSALWLTFYQGALFWIAFDIMLAKQRGLVWNYISTWYGTSKLDLIFKGKWRLWLGAKILLMLGALILLYSS